MPTSFVRFRNCHGPRQVQPKMARPAYRLACWLVAWCWLLRLTVDMAFGSDVDGHNPVTANFTRGTASAVRFGVHEIELIGNGDVSNPFDTLATVTFSPPSGPRAEKTVHAFYDGNNTWRARVYVSEPGRWTWSSACVTDPGLHGRQGTFAATNSQLRGRLLAHPKNPHHWMTEDGRWFLNLNDTAYFWLSGFDCSGNVVPEEDARSYARDATAHGITSLRSFLMVGPRGFQGGDLRGEWRDAYFADDGLTRLQLPHFRTTDERLQWLLNELPDTCIQLVLFPMGCFYAKDQVVWQSLSAEQRQRLMRNIVARYAAYPQVFWLVVNDVHYGPTFPRNEAFAREVGEFFAKHDPWRHPFSTGHARTVPFAFPDADWVTYLHLEDKHNLDASLAARYARHRKPVFLGEDRYEQDHGARLDPLHMSYWQRRLFWSWLIAGGSANYGGRWWTVHPYDQTGARSVSRPIKPFPVKPFTTRLTGLDGVKHIRDYFAERHIELSDFEPDDALAKDADGQAGSRAPKLARRGQLEFLIYHPHAAADGPQASPIAEKAAGVLVDLTAAHGEFAVEWLRADSGLSQSGSHVHGGKEHTLRAPWIGIDCVLRLRLDE